MDVSGLSLTLAPTTDWNLQSPNGDIWTPSITTAGVISFTSSSSGTVSAVPLAIGDSGTLYTPSISNTGVITLTSGASYTGVEMLATFLDSDNVSWFWQVSTTIGAYVSDKLRPNMGTRLFRLSVKVKYTAATGLTSGEEFRIYRIQPVVGIRAQLPDRYYALVDAHVYRASIKIKHGGSAFVVSNLRVVAQVRKPQLVAS